MRKHVLILAAALSLAARAWQRASLADAADFETCSSG